MNDKESSVRKQFKIKKLVEKYDTPRQLKTILCQHPQQKLQLAWDCLQVGLFLYPCLPIIGIIELLLAVALVWRLEYRIIIQRPINKGFTILSIWLIITSCFANNPAEAFLGLANFLPFFIVFAAYSSLIQHPAQLRQIARIIVIGSLPVIILGFGQLFLGWTGLAQLQPISGWILEAKGNPPGRMSSVFMYANILAAYLQMVFIVGLGLWIETFQNWRRRGNKVLFQLLFLSVVVPGNAIALILTDSRNVWGNALLACLAFAVYLSWRPIVLVVTTIASSILWASFGLDPSRQWLRQIIPTFFWARLTDELYPDRPLALLRKTQWEFAWWMTQERPWMGWGLRNFTPLYQAKMQLWLGHPHNLLLMLTAEIGIPATILFCGLISWILAQFVLIIRMWPDVALIHPKYQQNQDNLMLFTYLLVFAGFTLFNLLDVTLFDLRVNTLGWLFLAAICGVVYQYKRIIVW
jgi:O-antigen ligase